MPSSNLQTVADRGPADLVRRIGEGDAAAEQALVSRYRRPLLEMLRYRTGNPELAQDLLQDTLVIVIDRLRGEGLSQPEKLSAFMHRTAQNLVAGHFRKEARQQTRPDTDLVEALQDPSEGLLATLLREESGRLVQSLLDELRTPRDRDILLRFYLEEQGKPQICEALDLTPAQFDRVIHRARTRFRALAEEAERCAS